MRKLLSEIISDLKKCPYTLTFTRFLVGALPEVQNQYNNTNYRNKKYRSAEIQITGLQK